MECVLVYEDLDADTAYKIFDDVEKAKEFLASVIIEGEGFRNFRLYGNKQKLTFNLEILVS